MQTLENKTAQVVDHHGLVRVASATLRQGCRGNGTEWREWDLTLECGCSDFCRPRYKPHGRRGWAAMWHVPPLSCVLPAPKRRRHSCQNAKAEPPRKETTK